VISDSTLQSSSAPRWVRAVDLLCLILVVVSVLVAMSGGFRQRVGAWRLAVTSPYPLLLWAVAIAVVRHVAAPAAPVYRDLPMRLAAWWREPGVRTATLVVAGTRPAILFVGYLAIFMFGYSTGGRAPAAQIDNEFLNLPARWDANWYLGIAMQGYEYTPDAQLQQSVAFSPAYPLLVRAIGRLLGGRVPGYLGAGMLVSLIAFFGALVYLYALARETLPDEEARYALWLVGAYPFALFFGAIYTESLLLLGMVAACYHFTKEQFGRAFLWGVLVGLTKTNGFTLSVLLGILAIGTFLRKRQYPLFLSMASAAGPGVGMLIFSAFIWRLTGHPLTWLLAHEAWGRTYKGLTALVIDRYTIISNAGVLGYVSLLPHDLMNALGVVFVLAAAWPVARRLGVAYAVFMLVFILPPLAAGGLISAGRFSSVLFPAFIWMAGAVPPRHRFGWLASFAAVQAFNAALFYTWRPLY
jgi:hypothetical protein